MKLKNWIQAATFLFEARLISMRLLRKVLPVLFRLAVIIAVLMVGLFFTAAAITRAHLSSESPSQSSPAVNANVN